MGKEREEKKKERRRGKRGEEYRYSIRAEAESNVWRRWEGGREGGGEKRSRKEDHKWRGRGAFDSKVETRRGHE